VKKKQWHACYSKWLKSNNQFRFQMLQTTNHITPCTWCPFSDQLQQCIPSCHSKNQPYHIQKRCQKDWQVSDERTTEKLRRQRAVIKTHLNEYSKDYDNKNGRLKQVLVRYSANVQQRDQTESNGTAKSTVRLKYSDMFSFKVIGAALHIIWKTWYTSRKTLQTKYCWF